MKTMEGNWLFKLKQVIYFLQRNPDILDDGMEGKKKKSPNRREGDRTLKMINF